MSPKASLRVREGDQMPSIGLRATDGYLLNLRSFVARQPSIVLFFGGKDGETILHTLVDAAPRLAAAGVGVLPVSIASETTQRTYAEQYGLPWPLLSDERRSAVATLGVADTATVAFAVGRDGTILDVAERPEPRGLVARLLDALGVLPTVPSSA